jgi:arylsulfatase A-like enzyme
MKNLLHIACGLLWFSSAAMAGENTPPNILIILADDLGRGDYSHFGTSDIRTPAIDRLFSEGMDLQNFRANCPVCSPTRASLLTGFYPDRAGVPGVIRTHATNSWGYLRTDVDLLPQLLRKAGYHTGLVGKWHLGLESPNTPNERGFDSFHGFLGDMMDDYETHLRHGHNYMRRNAEVIQPKGHATDLFTSWACEYLRERAKNEQPFFLYLAYNAPHDPIQPKAEWISKITTRQPDSSEIRTKLVALIEHMDAGIGDVLDTLEQTKLAENTLVIFSSDNGGVLRYEANNGPWRSEKQHVYEGGLRVPCVVRWPGKIAPGSRSERNALTMDIMATCCEAAEIHPSAKLDGISFLPTLLGQHQPPLNRDLYFVRREGGAAYGGKTIEALIRGPWKLLQDSPFAPLELYNLADDPRETTNLAGKEKRIFTELSGALRESMQRGGAVPWQPSSR